MCGGGEYVPESLGECDRECVERGTLCGRESLWERVWVRENVGERVSSTEIECPRETLVECVSER